MTDLLQILLDMRSGQVATDCNQKFNEVLRAVLETGGKGELTIKLFIKPARMGMGGAVIEVETEHEAKMKKPELTIGRSVFFVTSEGELTRNDPAQEAMFQLFEFGSGLRQQDGQVKFKYTEAVKATVGGGQIAVPERFTIQIPAFIGGERVPMDALLRFRVKEGKLTFWYTLVRPEEVIRSAFIDARNSIAKDLGVTIINGTPA